MVPGSHTFASLVVGRGAGRKNRRREMGGGESALVLPEIPDSKERPLVRGELADYACLVARLMKAGHSLHHEQVIRTKRPYQVESIILPATHAHNSV